MRSMPLHLKHGVSYTVYGGPYRACPSDVFGVKMAAEIDAPCDVSVPTQDFSIPDVDAATQGLKETVKAVLAGKKVYVGCMGGIGRTGLMLALLAKSFGEEDPVRYVRATYYSHAVETAAQKQFIVEFKIPLSVRLRIWLKRKLAKAHA